VLVTASFHIQSYLNDTTASLLNHNTSFGINTLVKGILLVLLEVVMIRSDNRNIGVDYRNRCWLYTVVVVMYCV
jgi:hypothetical protein